MTLPNSNLVYILTSDPLLGSTDNTVPNGPFNRELAKLIANDLALLGTVNALLSRTYGTESGNAPVSLPDPPVNAPADPADGALHTTYYDDFEITFSYADSAWAEVFRIARVGGGAVYAEVNTGSGGAVGTVSGTTLAALVNEVKPYIEAVTLVGNTVLGSGNVNKVITLGGFELEVSDSGFSDGDRVVAIGPGDFDHEGSGETLETGEVVEYQNNGTEWLKVHQYKPETTHPTVTTSSGATNGLVSQDTIAAIAATNTQYDYVTEDVALSGTGYVELTFPRTVSAISMTVDKIVSIIGIQDSGVTISEADFGANVKTLHYRVSSDGTKLGIFWDGADAADEVRISYLK